MGLEGGKARAKVSEIYSKSLDGKVLISATLAARDGNNDNGRVVSCQRKLCSEKGLFMLPEIAFKRFSAPQKELLLVLSEMRCSSGRHDALNRSTRAHCVQSKSKSHSPIPLLSVPQIVRNVSEGHNSDSDCDIKQHLLHTDLCDVDDVVVADEAMLSGALLQNRGDIFPLAAVHRRDVVVVGRLHQ